MNTINTTEASLPAPVAARAAALLREHKHSVWARTDHLLAGLLEFQWAMGIILALWRSPLTFSGSSRHVHPHVWAAIFLGGAILPAPVLFALFRPGQTITRHTIAVAQMLMSGLLIHLGGGQIEMHFQIFGALAFLAFYRDWRVLVTASVVTATDHVFRGIFNPQSIYGLTRAPLWLTAEHAGWVVFEDIFLIGSCLRGVQEMCGIAGIRAQLENSHHDVAQQVEERTQQLKSAQDELMKAARTAGMAEIATSVLHNVGNVLNSVNVSAMIVADKLKQSEMPSLGKVSELFIEHKPDLANYLTEDERGKLIPEFLTDLSTCLADEQITMLSEVESLSKGIDHIKQIVAAQQSMAKKSNLRTAVKPEALFEEALGLQQVGSAYEVRITKDYGRVPDLVLDRHKVLQVLINLISNARQAVTARPAGHRDITLSVGIIPTANGDRLRYQVADNGMGIAAENLTRIFSHGFTTKKEGHGFGLHSAANAAGEMGGSLSASSDGAHKGAAFVLDLPVSFVEEEVSCSRQTPSAVF